MARLSGQEVLGAEPKRPTFLENVVVKTKAPALLIALLCFAQVGQSEVHRPMKEFFLTDANSLLESCQDVDARQVTLACHRIRHGDKLVVATRHYDKRWIDNDRFTKMTLVLPDQLETGKVYIIGSESTSAFFSTSLSSSPGKMGCYGKASSGTVSVQKKTKDWIYLKVEASFDLESPSGWHRDCSPRSYKQRIRARHVDISELGPWEGVKGSGDDLLSESSPS